MQIVGQNQILEFIDTYVESHQHKPILMVGSQGCGKHLFTAYLAQKLGVETEDITDDISAEMIDEIYVSALPKLYIFDISKLAMAKKLNVMLKFLEEPSIHYIVLMAESHRQINLPTIENRCFVVNFKDYTKEELKTIAETNNLNKAFIDYCRTPGQLFDMDIVGFERMVKLGNRIIMEGLKGVNLIKFLKVKERFDTDNNPKEKINIQSFFDYMSSDVLEKLNSIETDNQKAYYRKCVTITSKYNSLMLDPRLDKSCLLTNYLIELWEVFNQ